jgi:hypothetical protein
MPNNDNFGIPAMRQLAAAALIGGIFGMCLAVLAIFIFFS